MLNLLGNLFQKPPTADQRNYRVASRGYRTKCHIWRGDAVEARLEVWREYREREPEVLFNKCGDQQCIRATHLDDITERQYRSIVKLQGLWHKQPERASNLLRLLRRHLEHWQPRDWAMTLDTTVADLRQQGVFR